MLFALEDMPDEAEIYIFAATRKVTRQEAEGIRSAVDSWIAEWSAAFPMCPISASRLHCDGQVIIWAADDRPRGTHALTGSDLDPLFERLYFFGQHQLPPFDVENAGWALIVGDEVVPFGPDWKRLIESGSLTLDTFVVGMCTVAEWRTGYLIRRLKDDLFLAEHLFQDRASDGHSGWRTP